MDNKQIAGEIIDHLWRVMRGRGRRLRGISGGELGVMIFISGAKQAVTPSDISREFGISTARAANVLTSLEHKGYIRRSHDSADRRRVLAEVTQAGGELLDSFYDKALRQTERLLDLLGAEDAEQLCRLIGRIERACEILDPIDPAGATN